MPRPRPLANIASAQFNHPELQVLTPRTPRSRSGRTGEGYTDFELQQAVEDDDSYVRPAHQQSIPLLSSSASDNFPSRGYHSHGDSFNEESKRTKTKGNLTLNTVLSRLPLVMGGLLAGFLLFLTVVSYKRPDKLHKYFGMSSGANATIPSTNTTTLTSPTHTSLPHNSSALHIISYDDYTKFPLLPLEYLAECKKLNKGYMSHGAYWEAHKMGAMDVIHPDEEGNYNLPEGDSPICTSTITYMLDGHVGLLADLALLAQAAAFARERNRTFLIDDTYWNRGKWTDHFQSVRDTQPGPELGCRPPPPEELVACPRLARHWVINSRTAKFHFGHAFSNEYEDAYAHQLNRLKPMYNAAAGSLQETIRPNAENTALIQSARAELLRMTSPDGAPLDSYITMHIRRGDRKPAFYKAEEYIPATDFVKYAIDSWMRLNPEKSAENLFIYVASDSPSAFREIVDLTESRYTTFSLFQSQDPDLQALASTREYFQKEFDQLEEGVRIRATRGIIVDFALVSGAWADDRNVVPEAMVCTISSNVCKLSAVGMGWERAFGAVDEMGYIDEKHKRWVEIDQKGQVWPVWKPFELF